MVGWLRGLLFAWLRYAMACLIAAMPVAMLVGAPRLVEAGLPWSERLLGPISLIGVGALILLYGSPLVLAYRVIARKERPYLRWGYGRVALYGPAWLYAWTRDFGQAIGLGIAYEVMALAVFAIYVTLWNLGDALAARRAN